MAREHLTFEECEWCGKAILFGNALVSVNQIIQQVDESEDEPHGVITVIQDVPLLTLYAECGNRLDDDLLRELLQEPLHAVLKALRQRRSDTSGAEESLLS